jgi:hypothetical protein
MTMAITHSTSKAGPGRNLRKLGVGRRRSSGIEPNKVPHRNSHTPDPATTQRRIRIAASLRVFLGSERDALIKAQSLLVCVTTAMELEHGAGGPYYPDVIGLATDILRQRVVNMDQLLLDGLLPAG